MNRWDSGSFGKLFVNETEITDAITELATLDGLTATAAELNALDGFTGDVGDLNMLSGVTPGTAANSKVVTLDGSGKVDAIDVTTLDIGGTTVTATAAQLNQASKVANADRVPNVAVVALAAVDTAGGLFAWENPEASKVLVTGLRVHVTTAASGACTADIGPAVDGTTLNDTGIDGLDVNAATGVFDYEDGGGANGNKYLVVDENGGTTSFITGSVASGASAGIVGNVYIEYVLL